MQFFADISKISKTVKAIYVYASESSRFAFLENGVGYYALIYSLENVSVWRVSSIGQLLLQCPMWGTGFAGHPETDD